MLSQVVRHEKKKDAGMNYTNVVSVTVFIAEMDNIDRINKVYTEYFKNTPLHAVQ